MRWLFFEKVYRPAKKRNGEALGLKQFWKEMDISYDKIKAVKTTTFYKTMSSKEFREIKFIDYKLEEVTVILEK